MDVATIHMKATVDSFSVVPYIVPYKLLQRLKMWIKSQSVAIRMKATEQYFPVALFIMLYKVVRTFESVDEILKCDYSNESY